MVYRRRTRFKRRRRYGRKRTVRRRMFNRRKSRRRRALPISDQKTSRLVRLRYSTAGVSAPGGPGTLTVLPIFKANSIYRPNVLTTQTVFEYTKWEAEYNHYTVLGSKITYTIASQSDIKGMAFVSKLDDDGTSFNASQTWWLWKNDKNVRTRIFNLTGSTSQACFKHSRYFSAKKFFDVKDPLGDPTLTANFGASPSDGAFFTAGVQMSNLTDQTPTFTYIVDIDYYVKLGEPKDVYNKF